MSTPRSNMDVGMDFPNGAVRMEQLQDEAGLAADVTDIVKAFDDTNRYVAAGATLTLTRAAHNRKTIKLDTAAGSIVTLPAASGSGSTFRFIVTVIATSNSHVVKVANASDTMQGIILVDGDTAADAAQAFAAGATADTITLNRTTTGSVTIGEWLELEDIATNKWQVTGMTTASGTEATPFSAAV